MIVNHIGTTESTGTWRYDDTYVPGGAEYSLMVFLNSTSGMVGQFWGAYTQELILRDFLQTEATKADKVVELNIKLSPFPLSNNVN